MLRGTNTSKTERLPQGSLGPKRTAPLKYWIWLGFQKRVVGRSPGRISVEPSVAGMQRANCNRWTRSLNVAVWVIPRPCVRASAGWHREVLHGTLEQLLRGHAWGQSSPRLPFMSRWTSRGLFTPCLGRSLSLPPLTSCQRTDQTGAQRFPRIMLTTLTSFTYRLS